MQITSTHNAQVQAIRRAIRGGEALKDGRIPAEGPHLLEEALRSKWEVDEVWVTPEARKRQEGLIERAPGCVREVSARVFEAMRGTEHSQGVLALLRPRKWSWEEAASGEALVVVLDGIQDPGNGGTIVRSAEAFGATGVIFMRGSVRISNGKFLRATAGSIFRIPFLEETAAQDLLNLFEKTGIRRYALTQRAELRLPATDLRTGVALIVGGEGGGVSRELLGAAEAVSIPAAVESLNAAVACSIALFEAARQRGRV
jgi:TrmH family RNA methyltransferase